MYVVNHTARCVVTVANLEKLCEEFVPGRYQIRIVDLRKRPDRARVDQIVAVPTVARRRPLPERRVVGTLADGRRAAAALEMAEGG